MNFWQRIKGRVWVLIIILILVAMVVDITTRISTLNYMERQYETLAADVELLEVTLEAAADQISYAASDVSVEEWARVQGLMQKPGDIAILPLQGTPLVPTATPVPVIEPVEYKNWQVWRSLIFD